MIKSCNERNLQRKKLSFPPPRSFGVYIFLILGTKNEIFVPRICSYRLVDGRGWAKVKSMPFMNQPRDEGAGGEEAREEREDEGYAKAGMVIGIDRLF